MGGECSYWGCIPSKTLIRPGDVLAAARRVPGAAEAITGSIDVEAAFAQRDYMTSDWDDAGQLPWLDGQGHRARPRPTAAGGRARREGGDATAVPRRLRATRCVLSCGTTPAMPPIEGLADAGAWDNRDITEAKHVPRRLLVMGGGPIGVEMAQAFKRLGAEEVTVIEGGPRLLAREEPFAGEQVREAFEAEGILVRTDARVAAVHRDAATAR